MLNTSPLPITANLPPREWEVPPVTIREAPKKTLIVARVIIKEGVLVFAIITPLNRPLRTQMKKPIITASVVLKPL